MWIVPSHLSHLHTFQTICKTHLPFSLFTFFTILGYNFGYAISTKPEGKYERKNEPLTKGSNISNRQACKYILGVALLCLAPSS
jgi:hypothetical protein